MLQVTLAASRISFYALEITKREIAHISYHQKCFKLFNYYHYEASQRYRLLVVTSCFNVLTVSHFCEQVLCIYGDRNRSKPAVITNCKRITTSRHLFDDDEYCNRSQTARFAQVLCSCDSRQILIVFIGECQTSFCLCVGADGNCDFILISSENWKTSKLDRF